MSEHEKRLREVLDFVKTQFPNAAHTGRLALDALLAEQKAAGLKDAEEVFSKRQAELERRRLAAKSLPRESIEDMKREGAMCSYAIHTLRAEAGRQKKGAKG